MRRDVSSAIDNLGWPRRSAGILLGIAATVLGAPSAWNTEILGAVDQLANNILLLGGGFALSIFVGWVMTGPIEEASEGAAGVTWFGSWLNLLRYAVPAFLFFVLVYDAIPSTFGLRRDSEHLQDDRQPFLTARSATP